MKNSLSTAFAHPPSGVIIARTHTAPPESPGGARSPEHLKVTMNSQQRPHGDAASTLPHRPPRIKDVAQEAGVSTATVSHVINRTKYVSDETRKKVMRAIERFEYHPNAHARTLASGRSNMIGLLVSDISNPFFPELIKSIETAAFERGYNVILLNTNYDPDRAADYVRRLSELNVAGVALMTSELNSELFH